MDFLWNKNAMFQMDPKNIILEHEYKMLCVALFSLRFLKSGNKFFVASTVQSLHPMHDIVIYVKEQNGRNTVYCFMINQSIVGHVINKSDIKLLPSNQNKKLFMPLKLMYAKYLMLKKQTLLENTDVKIIVFTTNYIDSNNTYLMEANIAKNDLISTTGGKMYTMNKKINKKFDNFLDSILVYANQLNIEDIYKDIVELIPAKNSFNYINLIKNWCLITDEKPKLSNELIENLLALSYLQEFLISFKDRSCQCSDVMKTLWNYIKNNMNEHLILQENNSSIIESLILKDTESYNQRDENFESIKEILFGTNPITIQRQYTALCVLGILPYVVVLKNQEDFDFIHAVIEISKIKLIILDGRQLSTEATSNNLNEIIRQVILSNKISLQGKPKVPLYKISTSCLFGLPLFEIIELIFTERVGKVLEDNNNSYIPRRLGIVTLQNDVFHANHNDLFIITTNASTLNYLDLPKDLTHYAKDGIFPSTCQYVINNNDEEFKFTSKPNKNLHYINLNNNIIEWNGTIGSVENIKPYISGKYVIGLESLENCMKQNLIIIAAEPEMGKSVAIQKLAQFSSPLKWVLKIKLKDYEQYFETIKNSEIKSSREYLWNFFNDENLTSRTIFGEQIENKKVIILMDGFNEIAPRYTKIVTEIIKCFTIDDYYVVVTTRNNFKKYMEDTFNTFTICLEAFTKDEQEVYAQKFLKTNNNFLELQSPKLASFKGIPLHNKLLAEYIAKNNKFDLLGFYDDHIEAKIKILQEKTGVLNVNEQEIIRDHKLCALKFIFGLDSEFEKEFAKKLKDGNEKTGFVFYDEGIVFDHEIVADYFAAKWLAECDASEAELAKCVKEKISRDGTYAMVRTFFDLMIAK